MIDNEELENEDILAVFDITEDDPLFDFYLAYIDTGNVIKSLAISKLKMSDIEEVSHEDCASNRKLIDDYRLSLVKSNLTDAAIEGSHKHIELLTSGKVGEYERNEKGDSGEVSVEEMLGNLIKDKKSNV